MRHTPGFRPLRHRTNEVLARVMEIARDLESSESELPDRLIADSEDFHYLPDELCLRRQGRELEPVMEALRRVLLATPSTASPRFLNQLFGGRDPVATAAEMLTSMTNTSMYTFKVAGPMVLIEREVLARLAAKVGYPEGEGMLTPGGSLSNLTAMIVARNEALPAVRENGFDGERPTVYTSVEGHYSIAKNAAILGIGRANVRAIKSDSHGRMKVADLARAVAADRADGRLPLMINATAGTTVLGAFDPLQEIGEVARENGVWLHVDGALGGSVAMCPEHHHLIDGAELADSFTWNPHKMLGVPLACSAVLMRRKGLLWKSLNESASYLFQADVDDLNPGTRSIQCGRRNDALKLWAAWLYHGDEGFADRLTRQMDLARHAAAVIEADPELDLWIEPELINVCFKVKGVPSADVCDRLDLEGRLKIGHGTVGGESAIRLVCVNPDLEPQDIECILDEVKQAARELPDVR